MPANLYWIDGAGPGKLAVAARPRGGEWLQDEIRVWKGAGIDTVLSLLTTEEQNDLGLADEAAAAEAVGLKFLSFPIVDRQVPQSSNALTEVLQKLDREITGGKNVLIHCRQGIGRSGLAAIGLLLLRGTDVHAALQQVSDARGLRVPETDEQRRWIERYASELAATHADD